MAQLVVPPIEKLINADGHCSVVYMDDESDTPVIARRPDESSARAFGKSLMTLEIPSHIYDPQGKCIS